MSSGEGPGRVDCAQMGDFYACDEAAFVGVAGRWFPRLVAFFLRLGWQRADAEVLAQEVLLRVFRTKPREDRPEARDV